MKVPEFEAHMATALGITKKAAREMIRITFAEIGTHVKNGGRIWIPGFGSFKLRKRGAYTITTPNGAVRRVPPSSRVAYTPSYAQRWGGGSKPDSVLG